jgi:integrase
MPWLRKLDSGNWNAMYRGPDGRRKSVTRPTKAEARAEALELEAQIRRGAWADPSLGKTTFMEWQDEWLKGRVVEDATRRKNKSHLERHILPRWGSVQLNGITNSDVQAWVAEMRRNKVGAETVKSCHALFSAILEKAVVNQRMRANPARGVELPTVPKQPDRYLSGEEVAAIIGQLNGQDARMVTVAAETGLRWAELTGLHVKRVDLSRRLVHVVEVGTRTGVVKDYPKSRRSRRSVPLTDALRDVLTEQVKGRDPDSLVFTAKPDSARSTKGGTLMLDYTNWRRRVWVPAVTASGVAKPLPTFHDLRHSYASRLVAAGLDVLTVQAKMGHESLLTTQRYAHTAPGADDRVRAVLEAF